MRVILAMAEDVLFVTDVGVGATDISQAQDTTKYLKTCKCTFNKNE